MAQRIAPVFFEDGDALDPRDLNNNHNELASEFNNYLDRDNLPGSGVSTDMVVANAFTGISYDTLTTDLTTDTSTTDWQHTDSAGSVALPSVTINATEDAIVMAEFSCRWAWENANTDEFDWLGETAIADDLIEADWWPLLSPNLRIMAVMCIAFRIVADGVVISESGAISNGRSRDSIYLAGAFPIQAGKTVVRAEYRVGYTNSLTAGWSLPSDYRTYEGRTADIEVGELVAVRRKR